MFIVGGPCSRPPDATYSHGAVNTKTEMTGFASEPVDSFFPPYGKRNKIIMNSDRSTRLRGWVYIIVRMMAYLSSY